MAITRDTFFDAGESVGVTSKTVSYTNNGNAIFCGVEGDVLNDKVTGATWNGNAMTLIGKTISATANSRYAYLFGIQGTNATTGTHNLVISASSSIVIGAMVESYNGSTSIETVNAATATTTTSVPLSITLTSSTVGNWLITFVWGGANPTTGSLFNTQVSNNGFAVGDSNGATISVGSHSVTTGNSNNQFAGISVPLVSTVTNNGNFLTFM